MSKTTRLYQDTRTASAAGGSHLDKLNDELQDVTRIMTKNMEELLWRGDSLDRKFPSTTSGPATPVHAHVARRNVAPVDLATLRVREVPQGSAEYQHPSDDSAVLAHRGGRAAHHHLRLLAVLMKQRWLPLDRTGCILYSPPLTPFHRRFRACPATRCFTIYDDHRPYEGCATTRLRP